jgi:hypothetical protein
MSIIQEHWQLAGTAATMLIGVAILWLSRNDNLE